MKGKLLTTFFSLAILVGLSTNAFSQTIEIYFDEPVQHPVVTSEISHGTAILIIEASQDTIDNGIQAPDTNNPFFVSNGDVNALQLNEQYNPTTYFNFTEVWSIPFSPYFQTVKLSGSRYEPGQEYSFFVRIFSDLKGNGPDGVSLPASSFDANGNFVGNIAELSTTFYFDTAIQTMTIPAGIDEKLAFNIPGTPNWQPLSTEPIPEPSAMFLMAAGLLWFGRKLKRK